MPQATGKGSEPQVAITIWKPARYQRNALRLSRRRDGTDDLATGHPARQSADVAVLESALGAQGDLDRLLDVDGRTR